MRPAAPVSATAALPVAFLSESPADEAALRVLTEAVLGTRVQPLRPALRARGWPSVSQVLPGVVWWLQRVPEAVGLVVVVDSDDSPVHLVVHEGSEADFPECRLCRLRQLARQSLQLGGDRAAALPLQLAVGLAVPAVEAWYLCGQLQGTGVTEAAWVEGQAGGPPPYTRRELKQRVYGTIRPSLAAETRRAEAAARRLSRDLAGLEASFPVGFGALVRDLRSWSTPHHPARAELPAR
jgi:hypothetical protein